MTSIGQAIEYDDGAPVLPLTNGHTGGDGRNAGVNGVSKGKTHGKGSKSRRKARANVKVDIVCKGGDEWIKVNTYVYPQPPIVWLYADAIRMKESRLLQEFREQDSYINSDYDSDTDAPSPCQAGPSTPPILSNSLIANAQALLQASNNVPLLPGRRRPVVRIIFTRLEPLADVSQSSDTNYEEMEWYDARTGRTLNQLTRIGVIVQLGPTPRPPAEAGPKVPLVPTRHILLDLSILVALCCESSHRQLPQDEAEHQARFRALRIVDEHASDHPAQDGGTSAPSQRIELGPHSNASKDLSDQLAWEAQHPLIGEVRDRLSRSLGDEEVSFWVTEEVYKRLPGLVEVIGGPEERARAKALFDAPMAGVGPAIERLSLDHNGNGGVDQATRNVEFWAGSRWERQEGILADLRVGILPGTDIDDDIEMATSATSSSAFGICLVKACDAILAASTSASAPSSSSTPGSPATTPAQPQPQMRRDRRNRHRPSTLSAHHTTRLPSGHTLRTLMHGATRGWSVLSNNRGAVGKVCREMGIGEGLSVGDELDGGQGGKGGEGKGERAAVWIVNPSSLSEWRRREVEKENERVRALWERRKVQDIESMT